MIFKPYRYIYLLVLLTFISGVVLWIWLFLNYDFSVHRIEVFLFITSIILIFFIGGSAFTLRNIKVITYESGVWIVSFPFRKKTFRVNEANVTEIRIFRNTRSKGISSDQITIFFDGGKSVWINSLETNGFDKIKLLLKKDFLRKIKETK